MLQFIHFYLIVYFYRLPNYYSYNTLYKYNLFIFIHARAVKITNTNSHKLSNLLRRKYVFFT